MSFLQAEASQEEGRKVRWVHMPIFSSNPNNIHKIKKRRGKVIIKKNFAYNLKKGFVLEINHKGKDFVFFNASSWQLNHFLALSETQYY